MKRHSPLSDAYQAIRDLKNRLERVEQPFHERIRALEAELAVATLRCQNLEAENKSYRDAIRGQVGLMQFWISSGKVV